MQECYPKIHMISYQLMRYIHFQIKQYKVIEKRDDTQNGFRAYVFAPVIKGKVDKSQLLIGYAGTDPYSLNDIRTDLQLPIHHNTNNLKINNHYKDLKTQLFTKIQYNKR